MEIKRRDATVAVVVVVEVITVVVVVVIVVVVVDAAYSNLSKILLLVPH